MNTLSHACAWLAIISFVFVVSWGLLMVIDLVRHAKPPSMPGLLSILSCFAVSLISLGGMVLLAEAAKRQSDQSGAVDGVMLFVFCLAAGFVLLLGAAAAAAVKRLTRRRS